MTEPANQSVVMLGMYNGILYDADDVSKAETVKQEKERLK